MLRPRRGKNISFGVGALGVQETVCLLRHSLYASCMFACEADRYRYASWASTYEGNNWRVNERRLSGWRIRATWRKALLISLGLKL